MHLTNVSGIAQFAVATIRPVAFVGLGSLLPFLVRISLTIRSRFKRGHRAASLGSAMAHHQEPTAFEQSRHLLNGLRDEVYVLGADDLKLSYLNHTALDFLHWSEDDVAGKTLMDTALDFDEARFRARVAPLLSGETDILTYESVHQGRPVEVNLQTICFEDGKTQFVGVVRDISRRRLLEAERTTFVANVSHELRAPLTSVLGALKLSTAGALGTLPEKAQGPLEVAVRNVERLVLLINDLLDLEKIMAGKMDMPREPTDLSEIVTEAVAANINYAAELGISISARGTDVPHIVDANATRIIQVLNNLLSNASKFSTPGQTVEVELGETKKSVQIFVRDRGKGMSADMQRRIFDRFAQAETSHGAPLKGTGLGLSIAKAIVDEHHGTIHLTSEEGVGTTFCVDLPASTNGTKPPVVAD